LVFDNFLLALRLALPAYVAILGGFVLLWMWRHSRLAYDPNDDFTDEQYDDGFYVPRKKK